MELTIVQLNDVHAYLDLHPELFWEAQGAVYRPAGGYARIATLVKQIRAHASGPILFCDGGDTLHGTYPAVQTQGQALIPILNTLGLDAMTAHWEFAYGPDVFKQRASELRYPVLALNVHDKTSGKHAWPPYRVKEADGLIIGIVGLASNIVDKTMPPHFSEGLYFTLGKDELRSTVQHLREKEGADLIVLLSHLGLPQDLQLVSEVPGIDVCLSSHTHDRLDRPIQQGETMVIQSGSHGAFLGQLELELSGRRVVNYRHQLIPVLEDIAPDAETAELVRAALAPFCEELGQVVGETATALNRATSLEATMDNLLLQALLEYSGAQLAFSNGWRYGAPIPPGPVTLNDLYNIIPMNPPISTVELRGEEIRTMLEENLERTFARDPYNQMGGYVKRCLGLKAYIRIEDPAGHRIKKLFVGEQELVDGRDYSAVFVTEQGVSSKYGHNRQTDGERSVGVLRRYLARHRPIKAELRGTFTPI